MSRVLVYPPAFGFGMSTLFEPVTAALPARVEAWEVAPAVGYAPTAPFDVACIYSLPNTASTFRNLYAARQANLRTVTVALYWNPTRYYTEGLAYAELPDAGDAAQANDELRSAMLAVERTLLRAIYRASDVLIALSDAEADALAADFQIPRERIVVAWVGNGKAYPPGDAATFRRAYIAPRFGDREFVLCVGRVDANKNQLALVRALHGQGIPLALAGGSLAPRYLEECRQNADENVLFLPALSDADLSAAYAAARAHVLASWLEVVGFVTLEAGAAGCNVALSREHGARDYVGARGWYCDPADLASIREAVRAAYTAPRQTDLRDHLRATYSWDKHLDAVAEALTRAQALTPVSDDASARADLSAAVNALVTLTPLLQAQSDQLWQDKANAEQTARALTQGRVMRLLNQLPVGKRE